MSSTLSPKRSKAAPARRRPPRATVSWPRLLSLRYAMPTALRRVDSRRMSGCPEEKTEPRPCTQMRATLRRRLGSAITPSSQTPSRVRTRTSETGVPATGSGQLHELQDVAVGIGERRHPAAPLLALGRPREDDAGADQAIVDGADVGDGQIHHETQRVPARSADPRVDAHAEPDAVPVEVDEVGLVRARSEPERLPVEARHR